MAIFFESLLQQGGHLSFVFNDQYAHVCFIFASYRGLFI
jgi:hypothetical protein